MLFRRFRFHFHAADISRIFATLIFQRIRRQIAPDARRRHASQPDTVMLFASH